MPNNNIPDPELDVDPSEHTIKGGQSLQAESISVDSAEEQEGALDEAEASGGIIAE